MKKPSGRPGIPYEEFVAVWEQLLQEDRATTNVANSILGGSKNTIAAFRERYEREKSSKELSLIKSVKLTEAVHRAIAAIKVEEVEVLEKENNQLKSRIDEYLGVINAVEETAASRAVDFDNAKTNFDIEKLKLERQLAAMQARIDDAEARERKLTEKNDQLNEQVNHAKQEAAVAKKEVEMLREQAKKK